MGKKNNEWYSASVNFTKSVNTIETIQMMGVFYKNKGEDDVLEEKPYNAIVTSDLVNNVIIDIHLIEGDLNPQEIEELKKLL